MKEEGLWRMRSCFTDALERQMTKGGDRRPATLSSIAADETATEIVRRQRWALYNDDRGPAA